jgi:hypothetical protein
MKEKKENERESRDLGLMVLILLLGLLFMLFAGQKATQLLPDWSIPADMDSNLDPNARFRSRGESGWVEPVRSDILTPPAWNDSYLTPMPDGAEDNTAETAATVVVFDPSETPSATPSSSPTSQPTTTVTPTSTPDPTNPPPTTAATKQKPDNKGSKNDDDPPPPPPVTSTIEPGMVEVVPPVAGLNVGPPDGTVPGNVANLAGNEYTVVDITQGGVDPPITVEGPAETNYDLVYYEWDAGGVVMMDHVIVGISQDSDGDPYYEVFNWGDGNPDENTNVDTGDLGVDPAEIDNQSIPTSELHDDPPAPPPQTGVLIDVDNAPSNPPPGDYSQVVIISPDTGSGDAAQVDAVEQVDEPP